jgi:hypothetical protein
VVLLTAGRAPGGRRGGIGWSSWSRALWQEGRRRRKVGRRKQREHGPSQWGKMQLAIVVDDGSRW